MNSDSVRSCIEKIFAPIVQRVKELVLEQIQMVREQGRDVKVYITPMTTVSPSIVSLINNL